MYILRRINLDHLDEIFDELKKLVQEIKQKYPVESIYLFGSFARNEIHEGSDVDLLIVGDFPGRFHERAGLVWDMTDLPVEPLVYTKEEFEEMKRDGNPFVEEILRTGKLL